jgi:hypothetical protein
MKLTREKIRQAIREAILNEFYDHGENISMDGELIDSEAWLRAFDNAGITMPSDYTYRADFKVEPNGNYKGAWGTSYDALDDSGGPFGTEYMSDAIDIHEEMKSGKEQQDKHDKIFPTEDERVISIQKMSQAELLDMFKAWKAWKDKGLMSDDDLKQQVEETLSIWRAK